MRLNGQKTLKQRLREGETLFGTFFKSTDPALAEMLGFAGYDFIIADAEHSVYSYSDLISIVRAANGAGLHAVVRIPSSLPEHVLHACDIGAQGVQAPGLRRMGEVESVISIMRFYPAGRRGFGMTTRAANYSFCGRQEYIDYSNNELLCVIMVETLDMVGCLDELCNTPSVDVVFIGPGDLSQELGKPGQTSDPEVRALAEKIAQTAKANGKIAGMYCATLEDAARAIGWGVQYIAFCADLSMAAQSFQASIHNLRALQGGAKE
ncbi:MAG: HpcH/HpaI aldolase family protein [Christensenellales bacterium]